MAALLRRRFREGAHGASSHFCPHECCLGSAWRTRSVEWEKRRRACLPDQTYHAVLAVKDEREDALAACGGLAILDCCARREFGIAGNPAPDNGRLHEHVSHP